MVKKIEIMELDDTQSWDLFGCCDYSGKWVKLSELNESLDDFKRKCRPRAIPHKEHLWYCWKGKDWKKLRGEININFTYLKQPPKRYTFEQPKLKKWVESWCKGKVLNLFAGKTKLDVDEIRVDIDKDMPADYHMDAYEFITTTNIKFDTVILDPPYNIRKAREKYQGRFIGKYKKIKDRLTKVLNPKARVITLGYDSVGMSKSRGFKKIAICLVCHSGDHNDTIGLVEQNNQMDLMRIGKN